MTPSPARALFALLCTAAACTAANPDDVIDGPAHALGTITLGEVHPSTGGQSQPVVSAVFVPDATALRGCTSPVGAMGTCQVTRTASCTPACAADEVCAFDASCTAACVKTCTLPCPSGEECYFPTPGAPACRTRATFDAGSLAFSGTAYGITLFPPYGFSSTATGSPFQEHAVITVQASGAAVSGFAAFKESFTATSFLHTMPPLSRLDQGAVFGTRPLSLGWVPGADQVEITIAGPSGAAVCDADDGSGAFSVPREVLASVLSDHGAQLLTVSVVRQRKDLRKDEKTRGAANPTGWLQLITSSGESASFQCQDSCGGTCVDLRSDHEHCGRCDQACQADEVCSGGSCITCTLADKGRCGACDACIKGEVQTPECAVLACTTEDCMALSNCLTQCGTAECRRACAAMHQDSLPAYNQLLDCVCQPCQVECQDALLCTVRPLQP